MNVANMKRGKICAQKSWPVISECGKGPSIADIAGEKAREG